MYYYCNSWQCWAYIFFEWCLFKSFEHLFIGLFVFLFYQFWETLYNEYKSLFSLRFMLTHIISPSGACLFIILIVIWNLTMIISIIIDVLYFTFLHFYHCNHTLYTLLCVFFVVVHHCVCEMNPYCCLLYWSLLMYGCPSFIS